MSVDTEKPTVQSTTEPSQHINNNNHNNSSNSNSNSNNHHSLNKSMSDATIIISPPVPRMTTANSLTSLTTTSPSRQTPRSQTPPIPKSHPTAPESPRASYFRRIREQQERAMEKFFQTTIDAPCYALEEQIDNLTRCQQPLWNIFHHGSHESDDGTRDGSIPMGMYVVPQYCEYCGASKTRLCPATCQRPKLFFRKKRPPFCNQPHEWDAQTEYPLPKPKAMIPIITPELEQDDYPKASSGNNSRKATPSPSNHWVPG